MLNAHEITRYFGSNPVLDGVSLSIGDGDRVGLIGRNGCGKTTLLRILAGREAPDGGHVGGARRNLSVGYLPQFPDFAAGVEAAGAVSDGLPPGVPYWRVRKTMAGLGFSAGQMEQEAATLSGGEKTRLMLARLLLGEHDILLLDEPTSHLDITMLRRLEETLGAYRGAYLVVSHDRRFLDRTVSRIVELDGGRVTEWAGNYSKYAEAKRVAMEGQRAAWLDQQRQINVLREFIGRALGWAAKGESGPKRGRDQRGRIAEKVARRAHAAERRIEHMDRVEKPREGPRLSAAFQPERRGGQVVFEARAMSKTYGGRSLWEDAGLWVQYGERIGIVGPNGSGKTTLLRVLMGLEEPTAGEARQGAGLVPLYLDQEQRNLDPDRTVLETVEATGRMSRTEARTLLACFLFREDEVFKRVGDLSGGERARLAVAGAVVSGANLLVLDEPTNHLDIDTRERLEDAISAYTGTLLVVSHDRYLLDRLTRRTWSLEDGRLEDYGGPFHAWEQSRTPADVTLPEPIP